ncbi:amino acid adenylation domain-containing protein [Planobispora takensis]|uniref:Carrier domain-containing protein n=1 Tax=Planobispora takensis TaxID=1367882 RepID=A0A8J3T4Z9_9ACTN|nr:non-ribosomal peptide synthetase [Planobispora takensis]GII04200.1 hypothetical protein Pta02_62080 [Planobispora takensis]
MIEDAYPLATLQAGMLFHSELDASTYHDLTTLTVRGRFDRKAMEATLSDLAARHPILRTGFDLTGFSEPLQLVHDAATIPLEVVASGEGPATWREAEKRRPFDWSRPPLLRVCVHLLEPARFALSVSFHHAILDGWSLASLITELLERYSARLRGLTVPVRPPSAAFRDLIALERTVLASQEARAFWERQVADAPDSRLPRLPGYPLDGVTDVRGHATPLDRELTARLERVAREEQVPLRTVLLAVHLRVVSLLTGRADVLSGMLVHGRPESEGAEEALGLFLNTVPVRHSLTAPTWREMIKEVFAAEVALLPHRRFPLFEVQRLAGRAPLLDVTFDYRDFHVYDRLRAADEPADGRADDPGAGQVALEGQDHFEQTDIPMTVGFSREASGAMVLVLSYDRTQFSGVQADDIAGHYLRALAHLAADPGADPRPADDFLGGDAELIDGWNATARRYEPVTVHELVLAQARRTPEAPAVVFEGRWRTYGELASRALRLARVLREAGVGQDRVVGVFLERGHDLPTGLLGVLAAGGAYLPLEVDHPPERLRLMMQDAGAVHVVTSADLADRLPDGSAAILVDQDGPALSDLPDISPDALAYVFFTSGTTGRPKGVGVSHRAVVNRLLWGQETFVFGPEDRVLQKTPYGFDISVSELFPPLIAGAGLVMARPGGHLEPDYLAELITAEQVTYVHFVASMLAAFLELGDRLPPLPRVVNGGEALPPDVAARFRGGELLNLYGPTEATVEVSWHRCVPGEPTVPIGVPIANSRLEVLDASLQRVPIGVVGELYIAGVQLARGYLGQPGLTADRFVPDPYGSGGRLYRTGDLARWRPDGEVEYLGRSDFQVKIRGMRVELGEIEAALLALEEVKAAVVVARPGAGGPRLAAYVVSDEEIDWRARLAAVLPGYMVPSDFVRLEALPVSRNGKLDRAALPEPASSRTASYVPPRDPVEAHLAHLWEEALELTAVGVHDDFFELGGHSLIALRLAMRIRKEFDRELPVAAFLSAPTVARLADVLRQPADMGSASRIVPLQPDGDRTPIFFFHALGGQVFRYHPLARRLGADQPVYGVEARGLAPGEEPHRSFAEMIEDYLGHLRAVRPHGPYVLGGFCIGGNIAIEVARRLRAEGEQVPLVVLMYSDADEPVIAATLDDERALLFHALAGGPLEVDWEELGAMEPQQRLLAVMGAAAAADRLPPDTADVEQARRYLEVFRANAHAVGRFEHEPYDGPVALFGPSGSALGWQEIVKGPLEIAPIPEERVVILYEPLVGETATTIRKWMDHGVDVGGFGTPQSRTGSGGTEARPR